jgi:hypothetical protein
MRIDGLPTRVIRTHLFSNHNHAPRSTVICLALMLNVDSTNLLCQQKFANLKADRILSFGEQAAKKDSQSALPFNSTQKRWGF